MKILFWLKNKISILFSFLKGNKITDKEKLPSSSFNVKEQTSTSADSFKIDATAQVVNNLYAEISELKTKVSEDLQTFSKAIKDITDLKEDAKKAVEKSEKNENMVNIGFLVLLTMIASLAFGYFEFVVGKNDDYKYNLNEKINNQETEMKILKNCLKLGGWNKCF